MAQALARGYATTSTDSGHSTPGGSFALGHREKLIDYAYRSEHEMTVKAKAIVDAFYGSAPTRSYFNGCSTGGRQALTEATRYPEDFDGIIAGAGRQPEDAPRHVAHLDGTRDAQGSASSHPEGEISGDSPARACRMRRARRLEGRAHL
jgi:hypothetical protein